jgi:phosphoserine phosphatase RsbU/P
LLIHASGDVESLESTGLVLGIMPNALYERKTCRFYKGDLFLLFSDGVTEACRPDADEEFGQERLIELVRKHQDQPAAAILDAVEAENAVFTGNAPAADDVTLVAARRL